MTRRGVPPAPEEINDAIVCVIYQVTVGGCPVRRANLASLRISGPGRNLLLPVRKGQSGQIRIEWWETKNKKELTVELTPQAAEVVQHFVEHFRPRLMVNVGSAPDNPYLFPAGGQGHRDGALLNAAFVDRNRKIGGFLLNMHVQRHLTAFVILKQDPNGDGHRPEGFWATGTARRPSGTTRRSMTSLPSRNTTNCSNWPGSMLSAFHCCGGGGDGPLQHRVRYGAAAP